MDKPPQLKADLEKSDIELKVTDSEQVKIDDANESSTGESSTGESSTGESSTDNEKKSAGERALESEKTADSESSAQTGSTADHRVILQASKKAKEQEFLKAYKKKQLQTRIKFAACAALVLAFYFSCVNFIFNDNVKAASALRKFQIVPLFACLGERDTAHYMMTEFSDERTKDTPGLIEQRTRILGNSIAELEKNGKPAIFTRLGVEQMLMKYGDRAEGFKFGDALITRYPDLPSNYFWRAKTDFERMDYVNSVLEYKQAAEKLESLPAGVKQDWRDQLSKATWAAIFSGQTGEAERFLELFKKHGGGNYSAQGLRSEILLTSCTDIAAPSLKTTHFWNDKLAVEYQKRIDKALSIARKMNYKDLLIDAMPEIYEYELQEQAITLDADKTRVDKYIQSNYDEHSIRSRTLKALAALNRNAPQEAAALKTQKRYKYGYLRREQEFVEVSVLEQTNKPNEAIRLIDKFLNLKSNDDDDESDSRMQIISNRSNQQLLSVKARALCDIGQYQKAISLCDMLLTRNSHMIEPRLIKIRCFQALKDAEAEKQESEKISSQLAAWLNSAETAKHD